MAGILAEMGVRGCLIAITRICQVRLRRGGMGSTRRTLQLRGDSTEKRLQRRLFEQPGRHGNPGSGSSTQLMALCEHWVNIQLCARLGFNEDVDDYFD